jgi:hypothetical protein
MHHEIEKILEAPGEPEAPEEPEPFKPLIQSLFESFFGAERE